MGAIHVSLRLSPCGTGTSMDGSLRPRISTDSPEASGVRIPWSLAVCDHWAEEGLRKERLNDKSHNYIFFRIF